MIAVVGGLGTALMWAVSVLSSSRGSRAIGPASALAWVSFFGLLATVPLLVTSRVPTLEDGASLTWVAISGIAYTCGVLLMYAAFRRGKVGVAAPISSTEGAIAAGIAILAGDPVEALVLVLLAVIVAGVVITSIEPGLHRTDLVAGGPVFLAQVIVAALLFGLMIYATGRASQEVPVGWVVASGRIVGVLAVMLPMLVLRRLRLTRGAVPFVVIAALVEVGGMFLLALGSQASIAITAVLASQYAVIAALASHHLGERLSRRQLGGAVLVGLGVGLLTLLQVT